MVTSFAAFVARLAHRSHTGRTRVVAPPRRMTDAVVVSNSLAVAQGGVPVLVLDYEYEDLGEDGPSALSFGDPYVGRSLSRVA